jgi:hypothetical protein
MHAQQRGPEGKSPYVSETELRRRATTALINDAGARHAGVDPEADELRKKFSATELTDAQREEVAKRWIDQQVKKAHQRGYLMTDLQYADFESGRSLKVGDKARYIGPDRKEPLKGESNEVLRPQGQRGTITHVYDDGHGGRIVTFRPSVASEDHVVDLQVREGTPGFLVLERLPE